MVDAVGVPMTRAEFRLLPRRLVRSAVVLSIACGVVLLALAIRYRGSHEPGRFDERAYGYLATWGMPRVALTHAVDAVPPALGLLIVVLATVLASRRQWRPAALAALGPGLALVVTEAGKRVVGRTLHGMPALPSGHTTGVASVVATIAVLWIARARHVGRAAFFSLLAVTVGAAAMGVGMVALRFHYATDIIAGYCVGIAVPLAVAFAIDSVPRRTRGTHDSSGRLEVPASAAGE